MNELKARDSIPYAQTACFTEPLIVNKILSYLSVKDLASISRVNRLFAESLKNLMEVERLNLRWSFANSYKENYLITKLFVNFITLCYGSLNLNSQKNDQDFDRLHLINEVSRNYFNVMEKNALLKACYDQGILFIARAEVRSTKKLTYSEWHSGDLVLHALSVEKTNPQQAYSLFRRAISLEGTIACQVAVLTARNLSTELYDLCNLSHAQGDYRGMDIFLKKLPNIKENVSNPDSVDSDLDACEKMFDLGVKLNNREIIRKSAEWYDKLLEIDGESITHGAPWVRAGDAHRIIKNTNQAIYYYAKSIVILGEDVPGFIFESMAYLHWTIEKISEADNFFSLALEKYGEDASAINLIDAAAVKLHRGDLDGAYKYFDQAYAKYGNEVPLGVAMRYIQLPWQNKEQVIKCCKVVMKNHKDITGDLYTVMGEAKRAVGDIVKADKFFALATEKYGDDLSETFLFNRAEVKLELGDVESSTRFFKQACEKYGDCLSENCLTKYGHSLCIHKEYALAVKCYKVLIKSYKNNNVPGDVYAAMGWAQYSAGNSTKSNYFFSLALKSSENDLSTTVLINIAHFQIKTLHYNEALECLDRVINKCGNDIPQEVFLLKGHVYFHQQKYEMAIECYQECIARFKETVPLSIYIDLGGLLLKLGDVEKADEYLRKILLLEDAMLEEYIDYLKQDPSSCKMVSHFFERLADKESAAGLFFKGRAFYDLSRGVVKNPEELTAINQKSYLKAFGGG